MEEEESDEEITISLTTKFIVVFILGLTIGVYSMAYYTKYQVYRSPDELVVYMEEMMFNQSHLEDLHPQLQALIQFDTTTIGDFKRWYLGYGTVAKGYASYVLDDFCYKKKWNITKP